MKPAPRLLYGLLALAILSVSFSAILIKLAASPSLTIATNRMLASLVLLAVPWGLQCRQQGWGLDRRAVLGVVASGLFLALHFGTWTLSLAYTSVASSVVFVTTHPVLVALLEWLWLRQPPSPTAWLGIGLALAGSLVIGAHDLRLGGDALYGDLLALAGAAAFVGYVVIGGRLRQRLGFLRYSVPVYAVCWLGLLLWATAAGENVWSFRPTDLLWFVLLAVFATIGGHTVFNWTLGHLPASAVAVAFVGEPIGAAALAWLILGQAISPQTATGGGVILLGIYLAVRRR